MYKNHYDAVVIGSGIAGLNSALRLADRGAHVAIITKKKLATTATNYAQGGIAAVLAESDTVEAHVEDTLIAGSYHNKKSAVHYMVAHSKEAVERLAELGVPFATHDGALLLTREGGHRARRIAFVSDYTGKAIESVLVHQVRNHKNISLFEHTFAHELLVEKNVCKGVIIFAEGRYHVMQAEAVILATGGAGQTYSHTTNPVISTGDGYAMAQRAGAQLYDMEFVQFHPTAFYFKGKPRFLISEAVRGEGAYLCDAKGERFMHRYDKRLELAPRDIVSQSIFNELKKGPMYLDMRHHGEKELATRFPQISSKLLHYGYHFGKDLIPITPAAHYMCGGVKVDLYGQTKVKNLFAYGEVAYTGVQGANRLASNSLLEALVFSNRIVEKITTRSHATKKKLLGITIPRFTPLSKKQVSQCTRIRTQLKKTMWQEVGIVRRPHELKNALQKIETLQKSVSTLPQFNPTVRELLNLLMTAQTITKAALQRKTSLGCHFILAD
ncbi:L-aspartate oxidase [Candidatus Gracilibacteria bacterium]|nr:L-aspartate oxidase [Candidatus Gracilibacteria bacterium]